jgi:lambda family phage portal protein
MGVPLATGAIKTCRTNVVGGGLKLKSQVDYDALGISEEEARRIESGIEREFSLWADSEVCDIERLDNFSELQQLVFLNWLMSGDVLVELPTTKRVNSPYDLRIRLIEADRLCNPEGSLDERIIGGVEVNDAGEVTAYHIMNAHPLSWSGVGAVKWARVEAFGAVTGRRNVLHIMNRERIGQRRGVPFLAPVVEAFKQLGRYTDAELVAAVVSGMFTVFIEKDSVSTEGAIGEMIPESQQVDAGDPGTLELAPGAIIDLNEGEKANATSPGRPNANFDGFVIAICRQIGAALEIPYELLVKNFNASYSASRGALLEAWKMFRMYRTWLATDFCQPVYEEWLAEAVARGRVAAPGFFADPVIRKAYSGAEWNGPAQGLLNPVQEVNAAERRVLNGFSSREREAMEMTGSDFYRNVQQLKQEERLMREVRSNAEDSKATE